jgi:hypothetical protein
VRPGLAGTVGPAVSSEALDLLAPIGRRLGWVLSEKGHSQMQNRPPNSATPGVASRIDGTGIGV